MNTDAISNEEYKKFCRYLEEKCGIVLGENKQYLISSRLSPLLKRFDLPSLSVLFLHVLSNRDRELVIATIDAMTTNETLWFRDAYPFEIFADIIVPELLAKRKVIKIWSAASSSGQEPYSIAMILQELFSKKPHLLNEFKILATDVSSAMLEQSREGIYDSFALNRGLSENRKRMFFDELDNNKMQIKQSVRNMVLLKSQNLLESYISIGKFDVIFCRNVLIYFSTEIKIQIIKKLSKVLNSGGYLILGASESLMETSSDFKTIRCNPGIIYQKV